MKVKAASTIKKRIGILESYRKNCVQKHREAVEQSNESAIKFYGTEQEHVLLRIKDLKWVIGNEE